MIIALSFPSTDKALKNHVFDSKIVRSEMECTLTCLLNTQCESFNFQDISVGARHICELNDRTRVTSSQDLQKRNGFSYYGSELVRKELELECHISSCVYLITFIFASPFLYSDN